MDKLLTVAKYIAVVPVLVTGWGFIVNAVIFSEQIAYVVEIVTPENVEFYEQLTTKVNALWTDYEKRMTE